LILLILFGAALVLGPTLVAWLRERRENTFAEILSRDLSTRPSGADGRFTRRDHLMGGLRSAGAAAVCLGVALLASRHAEKHPQQNLWMVVMFIASILAVMAAVVFLIALARAAVGWKGPSPLDDAVDQGK
jgi:multisubunit Na+/H+ antiporter MnhG subunit